MTAPLGGLRVLDLSKYLPGLYASACLADLGAEVTAVAAPAPDRIARLQAPRILNRNKRSIVIDLKHPEGRALLLRLARAADVVLEGFRPGVTARLGIDAPTLRAENPRLVYCSLTGYGQDGPARDRVGHDINYLARAGLLDLSGPAGGPPALPPLPMADLGGALQALAAILAALWHRERTGQGQYVDVALFDGLLSWATFHAAELFAGRRPARGALLLGGAYACYNVYQARDGRWLAVGALEAHFWRNLVEALGLGELAGEQFAPLARQRALIERLQARFGTRDRDDWLAALAGVEACVEPVLDLGAALDDPQVEARGMVRAVAAAGGRTARVLGPPWRFERTPARLDWAGSPPGADGRAVLEGLGLDEGAIAALAAAGAVRLPGGGA